MPELRLAHDPDGRKHWLWLPDDRRAVSENNPAPALDLSGAGLAMDLPSVAAWLGSGAEQRAALLELASPVDGAKQWPVLRPGLPGKALALGRNFAAHACEMGAEPSQEMLWFNKLPDILVGPNDDFEKPDWLEGRIDPEAELVLLLGAPLRNATAKQAHQAIAAYTLGNDLTARGVQAADKERSWPWLRSKNVATFGSFGPAWIPADQMPDFERLELQGHVNGKLTQEANLADMIWTPVQALCLLSKWLPLAAGDIVFMGTPSGVGGVQVGDKLDVRIPGLLKLENTLRQAPPVEN